MIIKVVCAGKDDFSKLYKKDENEFLIGVDGGAQTLIKNKLDVDLAIGDFDSSSLNKVKAKSKAVMEFPVIKSESDLELTLKYIASKEFSKVVTKRALKNIIIYNATGKRLDHYQSTINAVIRYMHLPIIIVDSNNRIEIINSKTIFKKSEYKYISFFAIDEGTIISLSGFKYNLENYNLKLLDGLCLSNEIVEEKAQIETNNKKILVIQSN